MTHSDWKGTSLLGRDDYRTMNWKNGKGRTIEIAIMPQGSDLSSFHWRLSSACMNSESEFSRFPGYQRYLTVIEGEGLKLRFNQPIDGGSDQKSIFLKKGEVFQFSGDDEVFGELPFGAIKDLNFIFDPTRVHAKLHWISLSQKARSFQLEGDFLILFGISGSPVQVALYPGEKKFTLRNKETLLSEGLLILMEPLNGPSSLGLIELIYRAA